jgi:1-pyrroline-5-carboxylate dehydrogenase
MFYEEIFLNPIEEISKLEKFVERPFSYIPRQIIETPSKVSVFDFQSSKSPITSWMNDIPVSTIDQGFRILENFGLDNLYNEKSFDILDKYIDAALQDSEAEIIVGGGYDKSKGWFIEPTVIVTSNPKYTTMCEELFGPVLTVYVYDADKFEETLDIVNTTSEYALTGAVIAQDRYAIELATWKLRNAAGNFYINDKCTGAVVGQQPFGGARGSGTNDKAGAMQNLMRWVSTRTIKETFVPPTSYEYDFMKEA